MEFWYYLVDTYITYEWYPTLQWFNVNNIPQEIKFKQMELENPKMLINCSI